MAFLLLLCTIGSVRGADAADWIARHALVLDAVRPVDDDDFRDLEPLAASLSDVRVVFLGEASFGDGAGVLAKRRVLRFLHRRLGFDLLLWQCGLFDCAIMNEKIRTDMRPSAAATWGVYPVWCGSEQILPLFDYVKASLDTDRPIEMAGFDCSVTGRGSELLADRVLSAFDGPAAGRLDESEREAFRAAHSRRFSPPYVAVGSQVERDRQAIARVLERLEDPAFRSETRAGAREIELLRRAVYNLSIESRIRVMQQDRTRLVAAQNLRQTAQAENLLWLLRERYPDRRAVVWCTNQDMLRALPEIDTLDETFDFSDFVSFGGLVAPELRGQAFWLAVTAYSGRVGLPLRKSEPIGPAPEGSLEELCHRTGAAALILDLCGLEPPHPLAGPLVGRFIGYRPVRARWRRQLDAVLFFDEMTPCTLDSPFQPR